MDKPQMGEYNPYFQKYINLVGNGNFLVLLKQNTDESLLFFKTIPAEKHNYRYAEKKWTIKELLMHIIDTERVFAYRALVSSREDSTTILCSMNEDWYASHTDVSNRSMDSLIEELSIVRKSTEFLFKYITEEQSKFMASIGKDKITARAIGYITIGHILHHINIIKERYLGK